MSTLLVYPEVAPQVEPTVFSSLDSIARTLAVHAVRFERWPVRAQLAPDADSASILAAYAPEIARLSRDGGYVSADVVRLAPDASNPSWAEKAGAARQKFLDEHRHGEDEVRFFVEGSGLFALRSQGSVLLVLCEAGDLLSVPAGMRHWFDMGSAPRFCAIRLFGTPDGWKATFTDDPIARQYPSYDQVAARWR